MPHNVPMYNSINLNLPMLNFLELVTIRNCTLLIIFKFICLLKHIIILLGNRSRTVTITGPHTINTQILTAIITMKVHGHTGRQDNTETSDNTGRRRDHLKVE